MLRAWLELIRDPRKAGRRHSIGSFVIVSPKRMSLGRPLGSDMIGKDEMPLVSMAHERDATGTAFSTMTPIEAGDVLIRHKTTNLFDEDEERRQGKTRAS